MKTKRYAKKNIRAYLVKVPLRLSEFPSDKATKVYLIKYLKREMER